MSIGKTDPTVLFKNGNDFEVMLILDVVTLSQGHRLGRGFIHEAEAVTKTANWLDCVLIDVDPR